MPTGRDLAAGAAEPLLKRIKDEFPQLQWSSFKFLENGWDHEVIILDHAWVFRFPNSTQYRNVLIDEVKVLEFLSRHSSSAFPRYELIAADHSFAGYRIIPGTPLDPELFHHLSSHTRESITIQVAQFLTELHALTLQELAGFNVATRPPNDWMDELRPSTEKYLRPKLSAEDYQHAQALLDDLESIDAGTYQPVLTHGDLSEDHIIFEQNSNAVGFIDFSDRAINDPAVDFAGLYAYGREFPAEVYSEYLGKKDPTFLRRAQLYHRRSWLHMLEDSVVNDKISFLEAKAGWDQAMDSL